LPKTAEYSPLGRTFGKSFRPRDCIKSYELKDTAELRGPDLDHMTLFGIIVNYRSSCIIVHVKPRQ